MKKYYGILYIVSTILISIILGYSYFTGKFDKKFEFPENPKKILLKINGKSDYYVLNINSLIKKSSQEYAAKIYPMKDANSKRLNVDAKYGLYSIANNEVFNGGQKTYSFSRWTHNMPFMWYMDSYILKEGGKYEDKILLPNLNLINAKDGNNIWIYLEGDNKESLIVEKFIGTID